MFSDRTNWNLATNKLSEALARVRATGHPLIDLTASNPTECVFAYPGTAILEAIAKPESLLYEPQPLGLPSARLAVAQYYESHGVALSTDDLILTTSTSEAYSFVLRALCNPGDEILIPEPSYPLFEFLADIQDVKLVRYPLIYDHGWQIDFHALEKAVTAKTRAVIVVHPNNPTGHFVKSDEMSRLNEICARRNLAIVADEVFFDFGIAPDESRAGSFAANHDVLTFTTSGLSKIAGLPQMKAAWLVTSGPAALKSAALARLEVLADTFLSMNAPVQHALPELLAVRSGFQTQLMARVRTNLVQLDRQISNQHWCSRLKIEGGWYAVLRIPSTRSDDEFAIKLLTRHGVYVHPGHFYDFPSDGHIVVSLIAPEQDFSEGIHTLLSMF